MVRPEAGRGADRAALEALDGGRLCVALAGGKDRPAPRRRGRRLAGATRGASAGLAGAILVVLAGAAALGGDGARGGVELAGNARGEPIEIQVRNRARGETGLIARNDGFTLRFSNTQQGRGGA